MKFRVLSGVNCARQKVIEVNVKVRKRLYTDEKKDPKAYFLFIFSPKQYSLYALEKRKK